MISVVFSTRKDNPDYINHIKKTIGVKDYEIIQIVNDGVYSLTEAYNKGLKDSNNDIVAFIHDDLILPEKWGKKMLNHFNESDYGILGVAGTYHFKENGKWWEDSSAMVGIVNHINPNTKKEIFLKQYGFKVIEDASHAIGGKYREQYIGSCEFSDITVFSFHPVKIVTTAEGGAALTNQKELADKMALFRSHGITRDTELMRGESHGSWYYQQVDLGFNYRMTELQAALGVSQMKRLDEFVSVRHHLSERYNEKLIDLPVVLPYQLPETYSGLHLYVIRLRLDEISLTHKQVFEALREQGVGVNLHYIPVHTQPYYQDMGFAEGDFPESERYYREAISLPIYHGMTEEQQDTVIDCLTRVLLGQK